MHQSRVNYIKGLLFALCTTLFMVPVLSGCALNSSYSFNPSKETHILSDDPVISDINSLGFDVLRLINQARRDDKNLILSPISLSTALSILNNGAAGETMEQINGLINTLGVSFEEANSKYKDLISSFYTREDIEIILANSLWVNKEYPVKDSFIESAKTWYDADVFPLNVKSPNAVKEVNRWVADKTKGLITDPVGNIDPLTITLIVNSLYFKGTWVNDFSEKRTAKEDFTLSSGETVNVDMMNGQFRVSYYDAEDMKAVRLPYDGGASMLFLLPEGDVNDLVDELTADKFLEITSKLSTHRTNLKVPRLDFGYKDEMSDYLKTLGMTEAFGDQADFSQMVEFVDAKISRVLHECRIKLDEEGTIAAAVTVIEAVATSGMPEPEEIKDFYLDRPFVFAIMDNMTGIVLFLGKVENPLEQ